MTAPTPPPLTSGEIEELERRCRAEKWQSLRADLCTPAELLRLLSSLKGSAGKIAEMEAALNAALDRVGSLEAVSMYDKALIKTLVEELGAGSAAQVPPPIDKGHTSRLAAEVVQLRGMLASAATRDVLAERQRQVEGEGWDAAHDDGHHTGDMARAAACYAIGSTMAGIYSRDRFQMPTQVSRLWPWGDQWWKPKDRRRDLVRAGALILAEIERLDRALSPKEPTDG